MTSQDGSRPGDMLTEEEIEDLRRDMRASGAYAMAYFRALRLGKLDDQERADQRARN